MPIASAATATPPDPTTGSASARSASIPAIAALVTHAARRMFTRSAITPKSGPATSVGDRLSAATSPTNPAEPVFSHASQDSVTLWTQIACTAKKTPTKKRENWGSRNAPPAIISKALSKCCGSATGGLRFLHSSIEPERYCATAAFPYLAEATGRRNVPLRWVGRPPQIC
jgi:hypothetical protein